VPFCRTSDVVVSADPDLVGAGNAFTDTLFDAARDNASASTNVDDNRDNFVFVRVRNVDPTAAGFGGARGIHVKAVLAACSTGFVYPGDWDHLMDDATHVVCEPDYPPGAFVPGPLAQGATAIVRLKIPQARAGTLSGFSGLHACGLARVVASNDLAFTTSGVAGSGQQPVRNNIVQRNLSVV
jgi:hypothetical protein